MPLATDLFDYELPPGRIAQSPAERRDQSRLLVVHRAEHRLEHRRFSDLPEYLRPGDTLFRNNAAVLPARLLGRRPTGGQVECFLLRPIDDRTWRCLVRPGRKLPVGATFHGVDDAFCGTVQAREADGSATVSFSSPTGKSVVEIAAEFGEVPLPPYIGRELEADAPGRPQRALDRERYQTVYAARDRQVAVAAPTAGLHFTPELLARLAADGVRTSDVTLHVGLGTFKPIAAATIEEHDIHREIYEIPVATQVAAAAPTGRRIAVGTTTVRTLEDFAARPESVSEHPRAFVGEAAIYLYPPRTFRLVDAMITNFHQPRSTLLCLVAAFLAPGSTDGIAWLHEIYREALAREYRFLSYGDAMLIL